MAAASVNRPGGAQTLEKSQLILKGNSVPFCHLCFHGASAHQAP